MATGKPLVTDVSRGIATCCECETDASKKVATIKWTKGTDGFEGTRTVKYYCSTHFKKLRIEQ